MTKGIVAGSFDPITDGHLWLIEQACHLLDEVVVVIGVNPSKKYMFDANERQTLIVKVLESELSYHNYQKITVMTHDGLLINCASKTKSRYIIRGIRNPVDFTYEQQIQSINREIDPTITTLFVIPPTKLTEVSSSTVKGLVGFEGWERVVSNYVSSIVVDALREKVSH